MDFPNDKTSKIACAGILCLGFIFGIFHLLYLYQQTLEPKWLGAATFSTTLLLVSSRLYPWEYLRNFRE